MMNGVNGSAYPVPLASHDDVVKDPILFFNTLRSFHFSLEGSKFMIPVIGAMELNLHALYVEVTRRGGYDKVVTDQKWSEVSTIFDLSHATTSASYALRTHYFTILYHYELAYFFHLQGPMLNPAGSEPFQAIGTINSKFDCGYFVSVKLGDEKLNGVLYQAEPSAPQPSTAVAPFNPPPPPQQQQGRRSRRRRVRDPNKPKRVRSGINFFFAEKHSMLKSQYTNREKDLTRAIADLWNNLSPEERAVYQNYGAQDKERYQNEMREYRERLSMGQQP